MSHDPLLSENDHSPRFFLARWILPITQPPIHGGWVQVRGQHIVELGSGKPSANPEHVVDLGDVALLPQLVNAHTHLEFSDLDQPIGTPGMPLSDWIGEVIQTRAVSDEGQRKRNIERGWKESREAGVGLIGEITTPPCDYQTDIHLPTLVSFSEVLGLSPERGEERLRLATRQLHPFGSEQAPHRVTPVRGGISPHAPYSTPWSLIEKCVDLAIKHGVPLAMHVAESPDERELLVHGSGPFAQSLRAIGVWNDDLFPWKTGRSVSTLIELLARAPRGLLVHGNDLHEDEIRRLADKPNLSVVYCPRTHHFFGHAPHPVQTLLDSGVNVALGTDSRASNPDLNLWHDVQFLLRHRGDIDPAAILAMATANGARALGQPEWGRIEPGALARLGTVATQAIEPSALFRDCSENQFSPVGIPSGFGS